MNPNERKIVEDAPQYRSVMIAGPLSAPPMPRSFASMRPAKTPVATRVSTKKTAAPASWSVADLPTLPAAYFLERTNVYVDDGAQTVADRITDCLRLQSIVASCDQDDKNLLVAESDSCLQIAVRLFSDEGMVVVEIQRKSGCSFEFRETARTLLRAAKGSNTVHQKRKLSLPSCIPKESNEQKSKRAIEGVLICMSQLDSAFEDSKLIGMEGLEQMTRSPSRNEAVGAILSNGCLDRILAAVLADSADARSEMEQRRISVMKRRGLAVLANILGTLSELNALGNKLETVASLRSQALIESLVTIISSCECPHQAAQAARCCQHLCVNREVADSFLEKGSVSIISDACSVGASRSVLLEQESSKLQQLLSQCS